MKLTGSSFLILCVVCLCACEADSDARTKNDALPWGNEHTLYGGKAGGMVPGKYFRLGPTSVSSGESEAWIEFRHTDLEAYTGEAFRAFAKVVCYPPGSPQNNLGYWVIYESGSRVDGAEDQWGRKRVVFGDTQTFVLSTEQGFAAPLTFEATEIVRTSPLAKNNQFMMKTEDELVVLAEIAAGEGQRFLDGTGYTYKTTTPTGCSVEYSVYVDGITETLDPSQHYHFFHAQRFLNQFYTDWLALVAQKPWAPDQAPTKNNLLF